MFCASQFVRLDIALRVDGRNCGGFFKKLGQKVEGHFRICGVSSLRWSIATPQTQPGPSATTSSARQFGGRPWVLDLAVEPTVRLTLFRFIPAHAGSRRPLSCQMATWPVHPRACGEQQVGSPLRMRPIGSSPRMRGQASRPLV